MVTFLGNQSCINECHVVQGWQATVHNSSCTEAALMREQRIAASTGEEGGTKRFLSYEFPSF